MGKCSYFSKASTLFLALYVSFKIAIGANKLSFKLTCDVTWHNALWRIIVYALDERVRQGEVGVCLAVI